MIKRELLTLLFACAFAGGLFAQEPWFKDRDLTLTGVYYYPEHWDESQWERDLKQIHDLGFESTSPSSPGRSSSPRRVSTTSPGWIVPWLWLLSTT